MTVQQGTITIRGISWSIYSSNYQPELSPYIGVGGSLPAGYGALYVPDIPLTSFSVDTSTLGLAVDIVFLNANGVVVDARWNVTPGQLIAGYTGVDPVKYLLMVNAFEASSVHVGDVATITIGATPSFDVSSLVSMMIVVMMMSMVMKTMG